MIGCIAFLGLLGLTLAQNPGFRTAITAKGLAYIDTVGLPLLEKELANINIPDVSGSDSISVIGRVDYSLSNIHFSSIEIPTSSIKSDTSGLTLETSDISLKGSSHWHYREHSWPHISGSGSADLSTDSVSLSGSITIEKDSHGHATLKTSTKGCSLHIGHLGIHFHGGTASWFYNLFDKKIADIVKKNLEEKICEAATVAINDQGSKVLESLPVIVKIDHTAEVTYALLTDPIFNTKYVETRHKGEFLSIANPVDVPFSPPSLPAVNVGDRMMYIWLTDYLANSAGVVFQKAGILQYTITPHMVPDNFPIHLNTESFKFIIPALYQAFPNMDMEVYVNATKPPLLQVIPNGANFTITGNVDVNVIEANKTRTNAFVLGLTIYTDVHLWVHANGTKQVVSANCTLLKFNATLLSTKIGNFPVKLLEQSVNLLVNGFVLPFINNYANAGLVIPTVDGLSFVNPQVTFGQGYFLIDTDINYKPTYSRA